MLIKIHELVDFFSTLLYYGFSPQRQSIVLVTAIDAGLLKPGLLNALPPTLCPCLLTSAWDPLIDHYPLLKLKVQLGVYMPSPYKSVVKAGVKPSSEYNYPVIVCIQPAFLDQLECVRIVLCLWTLHLNLTQFNFLWKFTNFEATVHPVLQSN